MTFSAVATGRRGACCSAELTPCSARSAWYRSRFSFLDQSAYRPRAHRSWAKTPTDVLRSELGSSDSEIAALRAAKVI